MQFSTISRGMHHESNGSKIHVKFFDIWKVLGHSNLYGPIHELIQIHMDDYETYSYINNKVFKQVYVGPWTQN